MIISNAMLWNFSVSPSIQTLKKVENIKQYIASQKCNRGISVRDYIEYSSKLKYNYQ